MQLSEFQWLLRLLGVDTSTIPGNPEVRLAWLRTPESWGVFVLIGVVLAAAYGILWLYRREMDTCPLWGKRLLATLRCAVLALLLVIYLYPVISYTKRRTLQPQVVVLRDASQSMNTADQYLDETAAAQVAQALGQSVESIQAAKPTRVSVVEHLLNPQQQELLQLLEERGKLRAYDFAATTKALARQQAAGPGATASDSSAAAKASSDAAADQPEQESEADAPPVALPPLVADGQSSDLFKAVLDVLQEKQLAGVVMFTDGQHTGQGNLEEAARVAKEKGVPLFVVGVGDPAKPRNLQITDVYADPQVWRNDPFEIQAVLRAQDVEQQQVSVRLVEILPTPAEEGAEPSEKVLEQRNVQLPAGGGQVRLTFEHTPETAGRKAYNVEVQQVENESDTADNRPAAPVSVKVLSEQARVLLVAGAPSWEYRGVQRLLTRERSVNLSCWLQTLDDGRPQEGDTSITLLPADRESLFEYDVILLLDPDPKEFDSQWVNLLKEFISEHAGGVLYMAGPKFAGRFLNGARTRELADLLPVQFGDVGALEVDALLSTNSRAWALGVVPANVDEPIMRFYPEPQKTLQRWQTLPGIYWSFPSQAPKPGSRMLIEHTNQSFQYAPRPLLVTGQYGSGRTVYLGFTGTWRWRRMGRNAEFFKRFWIQTVRYLVEGRSLENRRRGTIETDGFRFSLGDRITLTARLKDASYNPLEAKQVDAELQIDGAQPRSITMHAVPNQPGQYEATLTAREVGRHVLAVRLGDNEEDRVETTFAVTIPSVESSEIWLQKQALVELAEQSGGKYFDVHQVDSLAAHIPDKTQTIEISSKPLALWDTDRMLILLVGLLATEWALRKRFKLL